MEKNSNKLEKDWAEVFKDIKLPVTLETIDSNLCLKFSTEEIFFNNLTSRFGRGWEEKKLDSLFGIKGLEIISLWKKNFNKDDFNKDDFFKGLKKHIKDKIIELLNQSDIETDEDLTKKISFIASRIACIKEWEAIILMEASHDDRGNFSSDEELNLNMIEKLNKLGDFNAQYQNLVNYFKHYKRIVDEFYEEFPFKEKK